MKSAALERACQALTEGDRAAAADIARSDYPFAPPRTSARKYTEQQMLRVFVRDGFIDRYSGQRLVFPGTLRLLSRLLPDELPHQKNWKLSATHPMYWDLCPTLDHLVPVARGGADDEHNQVTTTQLNNSAKAHWTHDEPTSSAGRCTSRAGGPSPRCAILNPCRRATSCSTGS